MCWRPWPALDKRPAAARRSSPLGYAGWDAGQLENEIREGVWLTCDPDEALVFGDDHEHKWTLALAKRSASAPSSCRRRQGARLAPRLHRRGAPSA